MKHIILTIIGLTFFQLMFTNAQGDTLVFHHGFEFTVIGKFHGERNYSRFPSSYREKLRPAVWSLGEHSAGISVRFNTNSPYMVLRWSVKNNGVMDHMPSTGSKGLDLYSLVDGKWKYINTARPRGDHFQYTVFTDAGTESREYLLNLPLYDCADTVLIGVKKGAAVSGPHDNSLLLKKPVVYYGSSIAQGGCASRPGMLFTSIMSRDLDRSFVNMGFSGNGTFDIPVGEAMCEIDAALYVIDCNPNTKTEQIYERAVALVRYLKEKRPGIPVLLVEAFYYTNGFTKPGESENHRKNAELKRAFDMLKKSGVKDLYYRKGADLVGDDYEGTVDGVHPNDLGMYRIAGALEPSVKRYLR